MTSLRGPSSVSGNRPGSKIYPSSSLGESVGGIELGVLGIELRNPSPRHRQKAFLEQYVESMNSNS